MPSSKHKVTPTDALALKQAANWQCRTCGRRCRRSDEPVDDFSARVGLDLEEITAHPRRWLLHVTRLSGSAVRAKDSFLAPKGTTVVLCGSCHRTHHNYQRRQRQRQQQRQQQERIGQLTLSDIRLPLTGLQLSLSEWVTPYEIVNPQTSRKQGKKEK
ncbi:MAG: hypothetical protein ACFB2W_08530 [Leptolyngbyaceae cyanobacterium]